MKFLTVPRRSSPVDPHNYGVGLRLMLALKKPYPQSAEFRGPHEKQLVTVKEGILFRDVY
jgi:hypothetical protein